MNILLIGGGGREHALAWKVRQSPRVDRLFVAPGNGGTARMEGVENVAISPTDVRSLLAFAQNNNVGLTVVGPEAPLAAGVVDAFQDGGFAIFGPTQAAAQLESSKAFSKEFMQRHNLPAAESRTFHDFGSARDFLLDLPHLPVIKASGLAAGKGVVVPNTLEEAEAALHAMLVDGIFGASGETVLVEERLVGSEISVLAFCDGKTARIMPGAQDHKRLLDGDQGPNTGGMGAFAPSPLHTDALAAQVQSEIFDRALAGLAAEDMPYIGVLYAGLMLTSDGPKLLEFNCRFGDPETQVLLPLLESDLVDIFEACIEGTLDQCDLRWSDRSAVTVVMAAGGYPAEYTSGDAISGLEAAADAGAIVFHAGTRIEADQIVTAGGRVLAVTGVADDMPAATAKAYEGVAAISFTGAHHRTDIASAWR